MCTGDTSIKVMSHSLMKADDGAKTIDGYLDNLFVPSTTFLGFPKKRIVFRFFSVTPAVLTLRGWSGNTDNDFDDDDPDIKSLQNGHPSGIRFGTATYFGNLILKRDDIIKIKKKLRRDGGLYVLFVPQDPADNAGQITYDIIIDNDDPTTNKQDFAPVPTGLSINPSPPRNSQ